MSLEPRLRTELAYWLFYTVPRYTSSSFEIEFAGKYCAKLIHQIGGMAGEW